jgi:hypothetical protein
MLMKLSAQVKALIFSAIAVLLPVLLCAVAAWMILKSQTFERLLYQYQLKMPGACYPLIRAYLPFGLVVLAICLLLPRARLLSLFCSVALWAASLALHVALVVRGAGGCCGQRVRFEVLAGGLVISLVILALAFVNLVIVTGKTAQSRGTLRGMTIVWLMLISFLHTGCGKQDRYQQLTPHVTSSSVSATSLPLHTNVTTGVHTQEAARSTLSAGIIHAFDDFSAAMGFQLKRFSSDNARHLDLTDTNYLSTVPLDDFVAFLTDVYKSGAALTSNEWKMLDLLIKERLTAMNVRGQYDYFSDLSGCYMALARSTRATSVMLDTCANCWSALDLAYAHHTRVAPKLSGMLIDTRLVIKEFGSEKHRQATTVAQETHAILEKFFANQTDKVAVKDRLDYEYAVATAEGFYLPDQALARLRRVEAAFCDAHARREGFMNTAIKARIAGLAQGMRGAELEKAVDAACDAYFNAQ